MKRLLIKIFNLSDLEAVIYRAIKKQQADDDKKAAHEKDRLENLHRQELALLQQEYEARLKLKDKEIDRWREREKEMHDREYAANMQIKVNFEVAASIMKETGEITKNVGRFQALYDKVSIHNENVKKIGA